MHPKSLHPMREAVEELKRAAGKEEYAIKETKHEQRR